MLLFLKVSEVEFVSSLNRRFRISPSPLLEMFDKAVNLLEENVSLYRHLGWQEVARDESRVYLKKSIGKR